MAARTAGPRAATAAAIMRPPLLRVVARVKPRVPAVALLLVVAGAAPARAQVEIYASDDVSVKLGILGQFQGDTLTDPPTDANIDNLFVRRVRLMFGGQVAKHVTFFVETDTPNLGKTVPPAAKNIQPGTIVQDAYGEFKASQAFAIDAGLMFVPFSHNSVQSAATLLPIDYGAYTFSQSAPTQSATGRDAGFQARGYLLSDRLEYRVGAFQGVRDARSHNPFRYVGRVQYNFLDTDTGFFYTGTSVGKKKFFTIGGAVDAQKHYRGYDADAFVDLPAGPGAFTGQVDYTHFDGDITFASLPKQNDYLIELGYLIAAVKLTPVLQFSNRDIVDATKGDENHWSVGLNYWWAGHNANVKFAYSRISPTGSESQNELTLQLQLFYF
jgi:phosphate-selective porin O/P